MLLNMIGTITELLQDMVGVQAEAGHKLFWITKIVTRGPHDFSKIQNPFEVFGESAD